jgi:hypothetical protein
MLRHPVKPTRPHVLPTVDRRLALTKVTVCYL